jgi:LysR family transcriptional activator of nhaA
MPFVLNFNHVYYFHVAATEGSIARAAERLGVTQPTVSEQIRALERTLAVELFERTASGMRLTDAGRQAYEHTTTMFRSGERLLEAVGKIASDNVPRTLRVGVTAAIARTTAADFLMPVMTLEESVPSIRSGDFPDLLRAIRAGELDLVLCESQPIQAASKGLRIDEIHKPRLVAVASPQLVPEGEVVWEGMPIAQYRGSSAYRWEVDTFFSDRNAQPRIVAEADDALLMVEAASRGACVAFVPFSVAREPLAAGRIRIVASLEAGSATVYALFPDADTAVLARRAVELLVVHARDTYTL